MLEHGGRLAAAARAYHIPLAQWLDLSTGINPQGWPVPAIPAEAWRRLPEEEDGLQEAAAAYYRSYNLIATAGSQAAIQTLPLMRPHCRVGVLATSYAEHRHAWQRVGHRMVELNGDSLPDDIDVMLLVNPNNPTGKLFDAATLLEWHARLAARGGWLIVDEAFIDAVSEHSIAQYAGRPGLVVLRSLGKFFGLGGARVGFVMAWPELLHTLAGHLGPWSVSHPARWVARLALQDGTWQQAARPMLVRQSARLQALLEQHGLKPSGGTALFQYVESDLAAELHERLAQRGILARLFAAPSALRFGLPGADSEWERLARALAELEMKP